MNLPIGSRVNVPHSDAQGLIMNRTHTLAGALSITELVSLRFVGAGGGTIDQTFPLKDVVAANPEPVDVVALQRDLTVANTHIAALRDKLAAKLMRRAARTKSRKR